MPLVGLGDIALAVRAAYWLVDVLLKQSARANQKWVDFTTDVQALQHSLKGLYKVFENAEKNSATLGQNRPSPSSETWSPIRGQDLRMLHRVCGSYHRTLLECKQLLRKAKYIGNNDNIIGNLVWNARFEKEVVLLRERICFHTIKIQSILQPLECHLILKIDERLESMEHRMRNHHEEILNRLKRLEWLLVESGNIEAEISPPTQIAPPVVERELHERFDQFFNTLPAEPQAAVLQCMGSFTFHFARSTGGNPLEGSSSTTRPSPIQYLSLMKCAWIMECVQEILDANGEDILEGSFLERWINIQSLALVNQTDRFSLEIHPADRLEVPDLDVLLQLPDESFEVWYLVDPQSLEDENPSDEESLDVIFKVRLPIDPEISPATEHWLTVARGSESILKIIDKTIWRLASGTRDSSNTYDVNLATTRLVPLYASRKSDPKAFNLTFGDVSSGARTTSLSFTKLEDLVQFQQTFTGYQVAFDRRNVKIEVFKGTLLGRSRQQSEMRRGRMQLWVPSKVEEMAGTSPLGTLVPGSPVSEGTLRRFSRLSTSPGFGSESNSLNTNRSGTRAGQVWFETGSNHLGVLYQKPRQPMLVMYLDDTSDSDPTRRQTLLAIKIDEKTIVNRASCNCGKISNACCDSSIERPDELVAYQLPAGHDSLCNLATLGVHQENDLSSKRERRLRWVKLTFETRNDLVKFAGENCECAETGGKPPTDRCHNQHWGVFGIAKLRYLRDEKAYSERVSSLPHVQ